MIFGLGVPVEVTPDAAVFGWELRAYYAMPSNLSQLTLSDYGSTRKQRSVSRWDIYRMMEHDSERFVNNFNC